MNAEHRKSVEEIIAERAGLDPMAEITVGGRDQPDIGPKRRRAADPFVLPFLKHAEELRLHRGGEITDLIEEERAAAGQLEATALETIRAGEGPALMSEEFGLRQRFGQGGAVDRHERSLGTSARIVDGTSDQFFPSTIYEDHKQLVADRDSARSEAGSLRSEKSRLEQGKRDLEKERDTYQRRAQELQAENNKAQAQKSESERERIAKRDVTLHTVAAFLAEGKTIKGQWTEAMYTGDVNKIRSVNRRIDDWRKRLAVAIREKPFRADAPEMILTTNGDLITQAGWASRSEGCNYGGITGSDHPIRA